MERTQETIGVGGFQRALFANRDQNEQALVRERDQLVGLERLVVLFAVERESDRRPAVEIRHGRCPSARGLHRADRSIAHRLQVLRHERAIVRDDRLTHHVIDRVGVEKERRLADGKGIVPGPGRTERGRARPQDLEPGARRPTSAQPRHAPV